MKHYLLPLLLLWSVPLPALLPRPVPPPPPTEWQLLREKNKQFENDRRWSKQRKEVVDGQNPAVVVLGCADSRVPPEIIFRAGIGQIFTVRTAGQVVDNVVLDSLDYAIRTFNVSTLIILGHTECGAVSGALAHLKKNKGELDVNREGFLNAVLIPIETAILEAKVDINAPDALEKATAANVHYIAQQLLKQSSSIAQAVEKGKLEIVGAEYGLKTGRVRQLFSL